MAADPATSALHVTAATEADLPDWLALADEVGALFGSDMANDPAFHESLARNVARGSAFCVHIDDVLSGAMLFRNGWINWLAVRRRFQHRGVGRALVGYCQSSGATEIRVVTFGRGHPDPESRAAEAFYRAMGFELVGDGPPHPSDGTPRQIFVWRTSQVA
jgi:ribosomal protein S18 acetylase RimI-like enzyme